MSVRVLQVVASTNRRGAEVFATDLAEELRDRGHAVATVALAPGTFRRELESSRARPSAAVGCRAGQPSSLRPQL